MQRFINSTISIRKNRFKETGSKFEPFLIKSVKIGKSLNSINCTKDFYTNYVNTPNQKVYVLIENFYLKIINNESDIFKEYIFDELYYNGEAINRLIRIINTVNNSSYTLNDLPNIYKIKNSKIPKIHLYCQILNGSMLILLVDLYHLSIPGDLYLNHKFVKRITLKDLPNIYEKYKKYDYNLNSIQKTNDKKLQPSH